MSLDVQDIGSVAFWVRGPHGDWDTNEYGYNFPIVKMPGITVAATKHPDKQLEVHIHGPYHHKYRFVASIPTCREKGLWVLIQWSEGRVTLFLNASEVETKEKSEHMTKSDAEDVFLQGLRFDFSAQVLLVHANKVWRSGDDVQLTKSTDGTETITLPTQLMPPTLVSAVVCEAFCVELYLKSIYCRETLPYPKGRSGHDLDSLFAGIPQGWRDRIGLQYKAEIDRPCFSGMRSCSDCPLDIESCLELSAKSFQKWRYSYEYTLPSQYLGPARFAIIKSILEIEPMWEHLRKGLDTPPTFPTQ